eukprot:4306516-Amphidinium_carterae.1
MIHSRHVNLAAEKNVQTNTSNSHAICQLHLWLIQNKELCDADRIHMHNCGRSQSDVWEARKPRPCPRASQPGQRRWRHSWLGHVEPHSGPDSAWPPLAELNTTAGAPLSL